MPRRLAHSAANFSEARKIAAEPSVTCEQSLTLMRPPITWLNLDSALRVALAHEPVASLRQRIALARWNS